MRRVLFVAYHYPPSVDAGAKRALGFHRHLPEHGWDTTVLTVRDGNYATTDAGEWTDGKDVVRVREGRFPWQSGAPAGRPGSAAAAGPGAGVLRRFVRSALYVPDPWRGFHAPAVRRALALHADVPFDAVLTTSAPWTALGIGAALRAAGLPWVADLRDLWLRNHFGYPYGRLRRVVDARLERDWLARADAITTTTEGQAELLRRDAFGPPIHTVRNGFLEAAGSAEPRGPDGTFRIVFAGKLYADAEASTTAFLDVLVRWRETAAEEFGRVRVEFFGRSGDGLSDAVRARGLGAVVRAPGLVSRERAAREVARADVALVLLPGDLREIVATKVYDAIGALTPVLLFGATDGEAAEVVRSVGAGAVFAPADGEGALAWLRGRSAEGREGASERAARAESAASFSYAALAGELAGVLDSVAD